MDPIRIFVGTDESQLLAVKVLEYSIRKHTRHPVEVIPMVHLEIPLPKDIRNQARTGFSFYRFCIPALCNFKGRAIYMDADMQVFKDITELWNLPMDDKKLLVQEDLPTERAPYSKLGAPKKRWKQCSVMLLDCGRLKWHVAEIIKDLDDGKYSYDELMRELCILNETEVGFSIPYRWNSLEHWDESTCNLHYTDMSTQPWVSPFNKNGYIWFQAVNDMIKEGALQVSEVEQEIAKGFFRPSLINSLSLPTRKAGFGFWMSGFKQFIFDRLAGYRPHAKVMKQRQKFLKEIKNDR